MSAYAAESSGRTAHKTPGVGREVVVLRSDWTDEDEARAEGYGPPESWLRWRFRRAVFRRTGLRVIR